MIRIFNGRRRSLGEGEQSIYIQMEVMLRQHIHLFKNGSNLNPFGVFVTIALHADENGWSFIGTDLLQDETGLASDETISASVGHLRNMRIEGHRVLDHYREKLINGQWGRSFYHVFPEAGGGDRWPDAVAPGADLKLWNPSRKTPGMAKPGMETSGVNIRRTTSKPKPSSSTDSSAGKPAPSKPKAETIPEAPEGHVLTLGSKVLHLALIIDGLPAEKTLCGQQVKPGEIKAKRLCVSCQLVFEEGPYIRALARLCYGKADNLTDTSYGDLKLTMQEIKGVAPDINPEVEFAADGLFERWWLKYTWQGRKRQRPKPHEIRHEWPNYMNSEEGGKGNAKRGSNNQSSQELTEQHRQIAERFGLDNDEAEG